MNLRITSAALLVAVLAATGAFAQLSTENTAWGNGPVKNLMTKDEARRWKAIQKDTDAKAFVDLFWAKRDPSPATPQNEYREQFDLFVTEANKRFTTPKMEGALSDRGRVLLALGAPTKLGKLGGKTTGGAFAEEGEVEGLTSLPTEKWIYEPAQVPAYLVKAGYKSFDVVFVDRFNNGDFRIDRSRVNANELIGLAIENSIVSPQLTAAPVFEAPKPVAPPAPVVAAGPAELKDPAYQAAVDAFKAAKESPYKHVWFHYMEEVTPEGVHFVPVLVYAGKDSGLAANLPTMLFGLIQDSTGKTILAIEEPAKFGGTKSDFFADKSLALAPGKYSAVLGLAQGGKPVTMVRGAMEIAGLDKAAPTVARLILSNNVFPLTSAQEPTDPYAFGGLKVIPKGDRVFTTNDELLYFFELRNPGLDETGSPKFQVKIDVEGTIQGKDAKGKAITQKKKYSMPLTEADVAAVKDTTGHFSGGQGIPLATFKPGEYIIRVKLIDMVTQANYTMEEKFTVVAAPAATPAG